MIIEIFYNEKFLIRQILETFVLLGTSSGPRKESVWGFSLKVVVVLIIVRNTGQIKEYKKVIWVSVVFWAIVDPGDLQFGSELFRSFQFLVIDLFF